MNDMMNRAILTHGKDVEYTKDSEEKKGTWIFLNHENDARIVTTYCPDCGTGGTLGKKHKIADDGKVMPSVICTDQECNFHRFIMLKDWTVKKENS